MPKETETVAGTTADPTLEFTTLELKVGRETKTFSLIYDFDAIAQAEELTGIPLLIGVNWSRIGVRQIRAMLYASMLKAHPEITLQEITPLIHVRNVAKITTALANAWMSSQPEKEKSEAAEEAPVAENPPEPEAAAA